MFSYSDHPHKIDCDCDWCNNYKANGEKFIVKVKQKLEQSLRKNVIKELTDIQARKQSLRSPSFTSAFPNYPWLFTNDTITFAMLRHVNSFFKYINALKYMHYSHDYILCKFMKSCYMKAHDLISDVMGLPDMVEWEQVGQGIIFHKKRNTKKLLHNLHTFINRYEYQKYYIIHIIQQTVISDDLITLIYSFVYL